MVVGDGQPNPDPPPVTMLQIGANVETVLLCQHRKRTSVAQEQFGHAF